MLKRIHSKKLPPLIQSLTLFIFYSSDSRFWCLNRRRRAALSPRRRLGNAFSLPDGRRGEFAPRRPTSRRVSASEAASRRNVIKSSAPLPKADLGTAPGRATRTVVERRKMNTWKKGWGRKVRLNKGTILSMTPFFVRFRGPLRVLYHLISLFRAGL